jgi:aminoglycoside phosphotransferase (APT) family kinase protein
MHPTSIPPAEVAIDTPLVRALLEQQHPDLAELPLLPAESGWDNAMYRLGSTLAVRLPRRSIAARFIAHEQAWLPLLAQSLPVQVPAPLRIGVAGCGYPWPWSVVPWFHGTAADLSRPDATQAATLVRFWRALHVTAPPQAPRSEFRGIPLTQRAAITQQHICHLESRSGPLDSRLQRIWEDALTCTAADVLSWVHGDLHARNVLCTAGCITAVIDWGDVCVGDRATDLAAVWMLLDDVSAREHVLTNYAADPATWARARGWAISFGVLLAGMQEPADIRYRAMGDGILRNLLAGP